MIDLIPLESVDSALVEDLLDAAFGRDRQKRTAYKVREGVDALAALCFAAVERDTLVGSIQCWPIQLEAADGKRHPMIMVGPVAVLPDSQKEGVGKALMAAMIAELAPGETLPLVLIGDAEYYGRFFGFHAEGTGGWELPGPIERHRLLVRTGNREDLPATGKLGGWKAK